MDVWKERVSMRRKCERFASRITCKENMMTADPITENTHSNGRHSNIVLHRAEVVRTCNSTLSRMTSTSLSCQENKKESNKIENKVKNNE